MKPQNISLFNKGIDRSSVSFRSDPGTFYDMLNMRHKIFETGNIIQTPYFSLFTQATQGTYYAVGNQTEPTSSAMRLVQLSLVMTDYVIYNSIDCTVQEQVLYLTTQPAAETIYTGCLLDIQSITGLGITLGSTIDVEMTGVATFRWRKNGGAYTAGLIPATTGVSIDGGTALLYFQAATGYAGTETWSWTRTDCSFEDSTLVNTRSAPSSVYKKKLYFINCEDRVMVSKSSTTGNYVISCGYRKMYASYLYVYKDHLFLTGYSTTSIAGATYPRNRTVANSDLTNVENFIATDTNEADTYVIPETSDSDIISTTATNNALLGIAEIREQLFVFSSQEAYQTGYYGLPVPFRFVKYTDYQITDTYQSVIKGEFGVYLLGTASITFFDGSSFKNLSSPIWNLMGANTIGSSLVGSSYVGTASTGDAPSFGFFNRVTGEFGIVKGKVVYVKQYDDKWYRRSVDFNSDATPITCFFLDNLGAIVLGIKDRKILLENTSWDIQPVYDMTDGTVYTTPKITTQIHGGLISIVKEISSVGIGAGVQTIDSTFYSTGSDVKFTLGWYTSVNGTISGTATTDVLSVWTTVSASNIVSMPRTNFRGLALEIQLSGLVASKPPGQGFVVSLEPILQEPDKTER